LKKFSICGNIFNDTFYFFIRRGEYKMREGIHPNYTEATITCACGNVIKTNSTKADMKVDICSKCHPFWTGNLKRETTGGRADKFKKKFGIA
jgi:large subunit ribosomal protein L31